MPSKPEPPPKTPFAARLRQVRKQFGMVTNRPEIDKKQFAELLGIEAQTYRRYEIGDTEPNLEKLAKIQRLTNVSLDILICGPETAKAKKREAPTFQVHKRAS